MLGTTIRQTTPSHEQPRLRPASAKVTRSIAASPVAKEAFGGEVVDHYLNRAGVEIEAFEAAVTDWERYRGFERL